MYVMMNLGLAQEIAAQRREVLTAAAGRHRLRRLLSRQRSVTSRGGIENVDAGPGDGRVLAFAASVPDSSDTEHASARVA